MVLRALEIIAHFDPLMRVIENPATCTGSRRGCGPTCAGGRGEACAGPAAASRELLYSVPAVLCEEIARAATEEAEHSGLGFLQWKKPIFSMFFACFGAVSLNTKNGAEGHRASFLVFWARSKAVSRCVKNEAEGHRALVKHRDPRAGERHQLVGHQMNEQVRRCAPCRRKYPQGRRGSGSAPRLPSWGCEGAAGCI